VRAAIFAIHLTKRKLGLRNFDLEALAARTEGFSGAEIEQAIVAALYAAHAKNEALATQHILEEADATRPLSVVMAEQIAALREWARERTVPADERAS
jgi:SpoVK/Ycf46/Vps4 family AAA+-type ATPase